MSEQQAPLLPRDALAGIRVGISVSESPDLGRLGLLETHFRLALGEIARCVLASGGSLMYGGNLQPDSYTSFLMHELQRSGYRDERLHVCLAWTEHRKMGLSELKQQEKDLGLIGTITCLDGEGRVIDPRTGRDEEPSPITDPGIQAECLTSLRRYMTENTHGRILLGGRCRDFQGNMPGLVEEALLMLEHRKPLYLAGGFGGVTSHIACALGVSDFRAPDLPGSPPPDARFVEGIERIRDFTSHSDWHGLDNGLTAEENQQLTCTHRPSEIATLLSLGLGRRFSDCVQPSA
ncbi:MAG: hypothetical protein U1E42_03780 [Rhodospirillales bacterium]